MKPKLAFLLFVLLVPACSSPRIDTSSEEKMKSSMERVRASLPKSKQAEFDQAISAVALRDVSFDDLLVGGAAGTGIMEAKMKQSLHGMTAGEVLQTAESMKQEQRTKEREQALQEIRELEEKRVKGQDARTKLANFKVLRSRFYKKDSGFGLSDPIIELTVRNDTPSPVSQAYFVGTLASPNRSIPWLRDSFNYSIAGGLEPGEEVIWDLAPNAFSDWGKVEAPPDAIFTVEVVRVDGPNGAELYSTRSFTERDDQRLAELKKIFAVVDGKNSK